MFWLRAFAVFLALMVIAPVQAAVLTAPRVAVAGGLLVAVGGITALIRRGQLLPAGAYVLAGVVAAIAAVCEPFIAVPHAAGSGTQWDGACLALFMAIPAVMMNRRFARRCAAAGVSPSRPVQAARIPPLSGVTGVRSLRVHWGWWAPVLLIIQIVTSAALLCTQAGRRRHNGFRYETAQTPTVWFGSVRVPPASAINGRIATYSLPDKAWAQAR